MLLIDDVSEKMSEDQKVIYDKFKNDFPFKVIEFATNLGIKVYLEDMDDTQSGTISYQGGNYIVKLNQNHNQNRIRFTLAHEIAHFLYDKDYLTQGNSITEYRHLHRKTFPDISPEIRKMDGRANSFATEILMPESEFIKKWLEEKCSLERIADFFNVSLDVVKVRAYSLGEIL